MQCYFMLLVEKESLSGSLPLVSLLSPTPLISLSLSLSLCLSPALTLHSRQQAAGPPAVDPGGPPRKQLMSSKQARELQGSRASPAS